MAIDFTEIQLFERVAVYGSIAAAARELGVTPSSATRKLASLEEALGVRLINRSTRRLALTSAGQEVMRWAQAMLQNLDQMSDDLAAAAGAPSGRIRLAAPHFGMTHYLPEVLANFSLKFPQIILDITTTDGLVNLIEHDFDIVIRYGTLPDSRAIASRLTDFERIVCAAPSYIEQFGQPAELHDLLHHQCIVHRDNDPASWHFRRDNQIFHQPVRARIEVDNAVAAAELCLAGGGVARLTLPTMQVDLDAGRLVRLLPDYRCVEQSGDTPSLWLVHIGRDIPYRVRLLVDHLRKEVPIVRRRIFRLT